MIKIENLNKYFNRYKKNQIHVINNTTITFPKSGLVALLGPSGCGKTTLLNAMGGLINVTSGNIYIDEKKITKRKVSKIDEIRNLSIGYIFQDYKLVENMTVFENVSLALKIIGIKDKEEIKKRVLYTLDKVNMLRYKNRPVSMLSGGERQRVGIARALVKNPKIILADEPSGNLDSKNSLEIMNIIKSISQKYLVVLVTHEEKLAKFYADRVIQIQDGVVINDYQNDFSGTLDYKLENRFYLKDFKNIKKLNKDNINISIYQDENEKIDFNVILKNGNLYIESKTKEKIEVIDNNSNIEIIDDHYKEIKNNEIWQEAFAIENISNSKFKEKYSSIFRLGSFIGHGFKKVLDYSLLKKILLGGFFLSGMFIYYSASSIFATINIKDDDFITMNKDYLIADVKNMDVNNYLKYESNNNIEYILPSNSIVNFYINYDNYLQTMNSNGVISGSLSSIEMLTASDILIGRLPKTKNEIVVDKLVLDNFIENYYGNKVGFNEIKDLLNHDIYMNNSDNYTIVGITDKEEPNIYTDESLFINLINNSPNEHYIYDDMDSSNLLLSYENMLNKKIKLVKGKLPTNEYEIIVNSIYEYEMPINKEINYTINKQKLKVVGYYENLNSNDYYAKFTNNETIKINLINNAKNIVIYSKDKNKTLDYLLEEKLNIKNSYSYSKDKYINERNETIRNTLVISSVILGISLIEILLMIRSSFLSRIKEVGIYRAIGIKKSDIYKMFSGEIIAITIIASFTGISFMTYILYNLSKISYLEDMFMVNIYTYGISLVLVLLFNILVGLIPVFNTIRKAPANILARTDVD